VVPAEADGDGWNYSAEALGALVGDGREKRVRITLKELAAIEA